MLDLLVQFYLVMLVIGSVMCVWLMQLIYHNRFIDEPWYVRQLRRVALSAVALGMLWGAKFCFEMHWRPWPTDLLMVGGFDLYLAVAIASCYRHLRREATTAQGYR